MHGYPTYKFPKISIKKAFEEIMYRAPVLEVTSPFSFQPEKRGKKTCYKGPVASFKKR